MIIRFLNCTFGALKDFSLNFNPGLNIIEGGNESGKSTLTAFIRAMFYGIPTSERNRARYIAEKNRYRPWDGGAMEGTLELDTRFGPVTLRRRGTPERPFADFAADMPPGAPPLTGATAGESLLGMGRGAFEQSAFISSPAFTSSGLGELSDLILNLISSGDEDISKNNAEALLTKWKNAVKTPRGGELTAINEELRALRLAASESALRKSELEALRERGDALLSERSLLLEEAAAWERSELLKRRRLESAKAAAENIRDRIKLPEFLLPEGPAATRTAIWELLELLRRRRENRLSNEVTLEIIRDKEERAGKLSEEISASPLSGRDLNAVRREIGDTEEALSRRSFPKGRRGILLFLPVLLSALVFAVIYAIVPQNYRTPEIFFSLFAVSAIAVIVDGIILSRARKAEKNHDRLLARYGVRDISGLRALVSRLEMLHIELEAAERELLNLRSRLKTEPSCPLPRIYFEICPDNCPESDAEQAILSALSAADEYERLILEEENANRALLAIQSEPVASPEMPPGSKFSSPRYGKDETARRLLETEAELNAVLRSQASLEGAIAASGTPDYAFEEKISELERLSMELSLKFDAVSLALKTLSEADALMRERFSPDFNRKASEIFLYLTEGRYRSIFVNREFEVSAGGASTTGLRRSIELSSGAADQSYFAVRLAICQKAFNVPETPPLILDDALLTFDDRRLSLALELLLEEAKSRQILLFTCHTRERRALTDGGQANIIRLL